MSGDLPPAALLASLAGLPAMTPRRLAALAASGSPAAVWRDVVAARVTRRPGVAAALGSDAAELVRAWAAEAGAIDPAVVWQRHRAAGVGITTLADDRHPRPSEGDPADGPAVLFHRGALDALDRPRVAVVGTRRCTRYGLEVAGELGADLAAAGVAVLSGLAAGIDGAAHEGALGAGAAPPVGVVGSGLDVVYPRRHRTLWEQVAERGLLLSEYPLGTAPAPWRFPARNRVLAALADVVVVVESHVAGGALLTAADALRRGTTVLAVPGSVRSPASAGALGLLYDGAGVCRGADDVLLALGMTAGVRRVRHERRPAPSTTGRALLEAFAGAPATADQLLLRTALDLPTVAVELRQLVLDGWLAEQSGWFEPVGQT